MRSLVLLVLTLLISACSQNDDKKAEKGPPRSQPVVALAENMKHPLAKYLEVAGFRMSEKSGGKLTVKMVVVNHSQADINDLALDVTTPACTVSVKVGALTPDEAKDASGECTTQMRIYELPDWQFIRPAFRITSPAE
jgi:hypothetical protein